MNETFTSVAWSIDIALGWVAEHRTDTNAVHADQYVAIFPEAKDALLRLGTYDPDERGIDAARWVEFAAKANRLKQRPTSCIRCGGFAGYVVEFATDEAWLRGWVLRAGSFPLDVTYRCDRDDVGRDDLMVDAMLNTLRMNRQNTA